METMGGTMGTATGSKLATASAYGVLRVEDYRRAKRFYQEMLGMQVMDDPQRPGDGVVMAGNGTMFELYERPGYGAPQNTALGFVVQDFDGTVADLRSRGVRFEEYDIPEMNLKTVDGVATMGDEKAAWFKDSEGNILSIIYSPRWTGAGMTAMSGGTTGGM